MQGLGNDFIILDDQHSGSNSLEKIVNAEFSRKICDRRYGVGADQILWLRKPHAAGPDCRMEIWNADGSTAEMCGNGIRAVAFYLHDHGPKPKLHSYSIETPAGLNEVKIKGGNHGHPRSVAVDMGKPGLGALVASGGETLEVGKSFLKFYEVSMGNPHAVIFVDDVAKVPVESIGPIIEKHPRFPKRTNVEFVQVEDASNIHVRVWERGAGVTLACGTGACAAAVASIVAEKTDSSLNVKLPGGSLHIHWARGEAPVMMEGPASEVFRGEYHWEQ